jgi:hypothetical protein
VPRDRRDLAGLGRPPAGERGRRPGLHPAQGGPAHRGPPGRPPRRGGGLLAGVPTQEDHWHASLVTFDGDWARFTEADLVEARERLTRLARTFELRLAAAGPEAWDAPRAPNWTLREIADHLTGVRWYAEQVGRLR